MSITTLLSPPRNPPCTPQTITCRLNYRIITYWHPSLWHTYTQNTAELKIKGTLLIIFTAFLDLQKERKVRTSLPFSLTHPFSINKKSLPSTPSLLQGACPFPQPLPPASSWTRTRIKARVPPVWGRKQEAIKSIMPTSCSRWKCLIKGLLKEQLQSPRLHRPWDAQLPSTQLWKAPF